jgi:hypothetical protein
MAFGGLYTESHTIHFMVGPYGLGPLDPSLVLGLGFFGMILLICWLGGTISPLEFLTKLVAGPFFMCFILSISWNLMP